MICDKHPDDFPKFNEWECPFCHVDAYHDLKESKQRQLAILIPLFVVLGVFLGRLVL